MGHHHHHDCSGGHHHSPDVTETNRQRVALAAILTGLFMVIEVIGGILSGSLALIADAGHMLTDFAALGMAWGGFILARRPANDRYTFGYERVPVLVAFVNGLSLLALAIWIAIEAIQRLLDPGEVLAGAMLYVAIAGLVVNIAVFGILVGADQNNLNIRGAVLHVLGDLLGSAAAIIAAIIILFTGWTAADPILSIVVAILILKSAGYLIRDSGHILLEGTPKHLSSFTISEDLVAQFDVLQSIERLQIWGLTPDHPYAIVEATLTSGSVPADLAERMKKRLHDKFLIDQATIVLTTS